MDITMNNIPEMGNVTPNKKRLDKKGGLILVFSLILSLIFFIIGFVSLGGKTLKLDEIRTDSVSAYEYVDYKFTPEASGYYLLKLDDATLSHCEDEYGYSRSWNLLSPYGTGYDYVVEIHLYSGETYTFELFTQDDEITILIERR